MPARTPFLRIKDAGWILYLYPVRFAVRFLPVSWLAPLGRAGGWLCRFLPGARGRLRTRLGAGLPDASPERISDIANRYYGNAMVRFLDDLAVDLAVVALRPETELTREKILVHCRRTLAEYKVPRRVELVDEIPANETGKRPATWSAAGR